MRTSVIASLIRGIAVLLIFCAGCGGQKLQYAEMQAYVEDPSNGLVQQTEKGGTKISVQYQPPSLVAYQEIKQPVTMTQEQGDSLTLIYANKSYFKFSLSRAGLSLEQSGGAGKADLWKLHDYLNHTMVQDLVGVSTAGDTLRPSIAVYNPMMRHTALTTVWVVFSPAPPDQTPITKILYKDSFLGSGTTVYEFDPQAVKGIPKLLY